MLDNIDRKLLRLLQQNSRLATHELAQKAAISTPTCYRRLKRLRENGVIVADTCIIDTTKLGPSLTIIIEVELERERLDLFNEFKRATLQAREVTQCYVVTGEVDFILVVVVPDLDAYNKFVEKTFYGNKNVRKFKSVITLQRVKFQLGTPMLDA
jgi:Lrp/AsnC family transcriptional regulator, leucine-responsive regulatory protein